MVREVLSWELNVYGGAPLKIVAAVPAYQRIYDLACCRASLCQPARATRLGPRPSSGSDAIPVELDNAGSVKPICLGLQGRDSARSTGPPSPRRAAGPLVPRSESLLWGLGAWLAGRVSEALCVDFLCFCRVGHGAVGMRLRPRLGLRYRGVLQAVGFAMAGLFIADR
ncbi:hypothetical protein NDU88_004304 [Pleurodeles waltl]|uniref:Uncharacterized protein n=1 Tax=Pleurodeles waltl TaxID=8319 RepID=A0AAV7RGX1_PLEWA|nr:hypothetical protein NDU88_004304 [Pleurodeles waltl]